MYSLQSIICWEIESTYEFSSKISITSFSFSIEKHQCSKSTVFGFAFCQTFVWNWALVAISDWAFSRLKSCLCRRREIWTYRVFKNALQSSMKQIWEIHFCFVENDEKYDIMFSSLRLCLICKWNLRAIWIAKISSWLQFENVQRIDHRFECTCSMW